MERMLDIKRSIIVISAFLLIFLFYCFFYSSKYNLEVTNYHLTSPKIAQPIRIVQLTDLHNSEFGKENSRLVEMIRKQNPDMILLTGDMLNGDEPDTRIAVNLLDQLSQITPVYASWGNHEQENNILFGTDVTGLYEQVGATVLEKTYEDVEVNGQMIRVGGILGYCLAEPYLRTGEAKEYEIAYLRQFENTELLTILMCHDPLCWIVNDNLEQWDIDAVFSGHDHGGQIRLPWIGGIYAPDQGYFPGRASGLYPSEDGKRVMVLSRGLGSRGRIPRLNNVPELVVVDILPQGVHDERQGIDQ